MDKQGRKREDKIDREGGERENRSDCGNRIFIWQMKEGRRGGKRNTRRRAGT